MVRQSVNMKWLDSFVVQAAAEFPQQVVVTLPE